MSERRRPHPVPNYARQQVVLPHKVTRMVLLEGGVQVLVDTNPGTGVKANVIFFDKHEAGKRKGPA